MFENFSNQSTTSTSNQQKTKNDNEEENSSKKDILGLILISIAILAGVTAIGTKISIIILPRNRAIYGIIFSIICAIVSMCFYIIENG
jgi:hypothetical protein